MLSSSPEITTALARKAGIGVSRVRAHILDWPTIERDRAALWPCFEIAARATYDRYAAEDLEQMTRSGELLVFAIVQEGQPPAVLALVWAQRIQQGRKTVGELCFAGAHPKAGKMVSGGWADAFRQMAGFLAEAGCDQVTLTGRPGWGRVLGLTPTAAQFVVTAKRRVGHGI